MFMVHTSLLLMVLESRANKLNRLVKFIDETKQDYHGTETKLSVSEMEQILYDVIERKWTYDQHTCKGYIEELKKLGWLTQEYLDK